MKSRFFDRLLGNPFDRLLAKAAKRDARRFLLYWNRGLGDISLGLYSVVERIRTFIPNAEITVATRAELDEPFRLLQVQRVFADPKLIRKGSDSPDDVFTRVGLDRKNFDVVLDQVDPTRWLSWQLGKVTPKLDWKPEYDRLCEKFPEIDPTKPCIGAHANSETGHYYGYVKDWPREYWQDLIAKTEAAGPVQFVLFGHSADDSFHSPSIIDLRGKTTFLEMLSVIKNRCDMLVAPDSGILSMVYYLNCDFPLTIVSLWADPRQGILKQGVASPNGSLKHYPLLGEEEDISQITVDQVLALITQQGIGRAHQLASPT